MPLMLTTRYAEMPQNPEKVAEFTDTSGKHFIVIERNGIRFIQELTMGKTHALPSIGLGESSRDIKQHNRE